MRKSLGEKFEFDIVDWLLEYSFCSAPQLMNLVCPVHSSSTS